MESLPTSILPLGLAQQNLCSLIDRGLEHQVTNSFSGLGGRCEAISPGQKS